MKRTCFCALAVCLLASFAACGDASQEEFNEPTESRRPSADGDIVPQPNTGCEAAPFQLRGPFDVGYTEVTLDGTTVSIFYPARVEEPTFERLRYDLRDWLPQEQAERIPNGEAPLFEVDAYLDAPAAPEAAPAPSVLFAHGLAGYRLQSSTLLSHLASWGVVAVAPENEGINLRTILETGTIAGDRGAELLGAAFAALPSWNTDQPALRGLLDPTAVTVMGHSMGSAAASVQTSLPDVRGWVALAGAGFGEAAPVDFLIVGGTTDSLAGPEAIARGFESQRGSRSMVLVGGAGHLAFTDICEIAADRGGVLAVASEYGLDVPPLVAELGRDGCRETDLPVREAWPVIHHFVTAHIRAAVGLDREPRGLDMPAASCFGPRVRELRSHEAATPEEVFEGMDDEAANRGPDGDRGVPPNDDPASEGPVDAPQDPTNDYSPYEGNVGCGDSTCDITSNVCCTSLFGQTCEPGDSCGAFSSPAVCDGPEDCDGGVCCVGFPDGASCNAECADPQQTLCHFDADCPGAQVCKTCTYPGNSIVTICGDPGALVQGAEGCDR